MTSKLIVDPIACAGHGICAELFPERITLDDWGYPIIDPAPIAGSLTRHARRAVVECPVKALKLTTRSGAPPRLRPGPRRR